MRAVVLKQKDTAMKLSAHIFSMGYLADLVPTVFQTLTDIGYFYDPVERGREGSVLNLAACVTLSGS